MAKLLRVKDVAIELDCSLTNVYALINTGQLRSIQVGSGGKGRRVHPDELARFLAEGPSTLPKRIQNRDGKVRKLKVLDGDAILAAWRQRDAAAGQLGVDSTRSVSS